LTAEAIIGIKLNTLAGGKLSTHPALVNAIISGLQAMLGGAFPAYNIIVFDDREPYKFTGAGFTLKDLPGEYRCVTLRDAWSSATYDIAGVSQKLGSRLDEMDYIINVPVLKDHNEAGITFSLKNFYGIVDKPGDMHITQCDPYISEVYKLVAGKVKLIVGDCIFGAHSGGPDASPTFILNTILVGSDPVAMDVQALNLINTERARRNLALISLEPDGEARHLSTAASDTYRLGNIIPVINDVIV
jgi:uncharacterized protein (DUF362 family)